MAHYYEAHPFTDAQAEHATTVIMAMLQKRRFFLYHHPEHSSSNADPDYTLDSKVFAHVIQLDEALRAAHTRMKQIAETVISRTEKRLGIAAPDLSDNKQVVTCRRYTGGFDICRVYPFTAFTTLAPRSLDELIEQQFQRLMGKDSEDDVAPKTLRERRASAKGLSEKIWEQLNGLDFQNPKNHRCLIVLQSRCNLGRYDNDDFAEGRVWDIQNHPQAVGYLFHAYSEQTRIVHPSHIVCSTSRTLHVNIQHWGDRPPTINYTASAGYDCSAFFVTVL